MAGTIRTKLPQLRVACGFLAAALLAACGPAGAANAVLPDGTYQYDIVDSGQLASTTRIVVTRTANAIVISEHSEPMEPAEVTRRALDAATFAALSFADDIGGRTFTTVTLRDGKAIIALDGRQTTLSAAPGAPFAVFDANAASFFQLPAMLHGVSTSRLTLANLFIGYSSMPLSALSSKTPRPAGVPARDAAQDVTIDGKRGTMWYDPRSYVLDRFDLPSQRLAFVRKSYVDVVESLP